MTDLWDAGRSFVGEFDTKVARIANLDIEYTEWNPGAARSVVLVHGFNVQGHTWDPIASVLARDMHVIVPDLRGHGGSSWTREGYWTRNFVTDLMALASIVGLERYDVVGHSLGARIGIALAAEDADRVMHLVLSDCGPELPRDAARRSSVRARRNADRMGFRSREEALAAYQEDHPEWRPIFHQLHAQYQLRENWAGMFVNRADPDVYWLTRSAGRRDEAYLWDACGRIRCAVLMLWGAESAYTDADLVSRMDAAISDFYSVKLDCGHYIPRQLPDEFCALTTEFLAPRS